MPRRNKNARTRKQKPYHIMAKHKQKLEVEKKVEQQLAYIEQQENRKRKQLQEDEESKHNERLENIGATIILVFMAILIACFVSVIIQEVIMFKELAGLVIGLLVVSAISVLTWAGIVYVTALVAKSALF